MGYYNDILGGKENSGLYFTAYGIALKHGFKGTEKEWLNSLQGKSAYELAVENGYTGTLAQWSSELSGQKEVIQALTALITNHKSRSDNPHTVTASQVGAYTKAEADNKFLDNLRIITGAQIENTDGIDEGEVVFYREDGNIPGTAPFESAIIFSLLQPIIPDGYGTFAVTPYNHIAIDSAGTIWVRSTFRDWQEAYSGFATTEYVDGCVTDKLPRSEFDVYFSDSDGTFTMNDLQYTVDDRANSHGVEANRIWASDATFTIKATGKVLGFNYSFGEQGVCNCSITVNGVEYTAPTGNIPMQEMTSDIILFIQFGYADFTNMVTDKRSIPNEINAIKADIGDIDVALDGIIALQNELAGGGV